MKKVLDMSKDAWKLLKAYAALKGLNIGEAAEDLINEHLSKLKEVLENV